MYLFFGDCASGPLQNADPIAWTTTVDPFDLEEAAPDLHWVLGNDEQFRRLAVNELPPLGNFEVPTGGFGYDGRVFVFVANKRGDPDVMTASYLAEAFDPANNLAQIEFISSTIGGQIPTIELDGSVGAAPFPGGRWMLHISATVVNNADWPGLPADTGQGLIMFGSSLYRGGPAGHLTAEEEARSNVYLAWAPLMPGVAPPKAPIPQPDEWQFLTHFTPAGAPLFGTLSAGATPKPILPADPSGPRLLGEISGVWFPGLRRWVLAGSVPAPINLARAPWGPWTNSDSICDPARPERDAGNLDPVPGHLWNETKVVYAPYLVERWTRWDRSTRQTTLYYTLSVYDRPNGQKRYQPQLMRSDISCLP
jgi:hypothetical protein